MPPCRDVFACVRIDYFVVNSYMINFFMDEKIDHSHPNVAGGLFVASKYSASTKGSSAICLTMLSITSLGSIANLAVITSSETTGRKTKLAWSLELA